MGEGPKSRAESFARSLEREVSADVDDIRASPRIVTVWAYIPQMRVNRAQQIAGAHDFMLAYGSKDAREEGVGYYRFESDIGIAERNGGLGLPGGVK